MKNISSLLLFFILFLLPIIHPLQLLSSPNNITLSPGEEKEVSVILYNDESEEIRVVMEGIFPKGIYFRGGEISLKKGEKKEGIGKIRIDGNYSGSNPAVGYILIEEKEKVIAAALLKKITINVEGIERGGKENGEEIIQQLPEKIKGGIILTPPKKPTLSQETLLLLKFPSLKKREISLPAMVGVFFLFSLILYWAFSEIVKGYGKV